MTKTYYHATPFENLESIFMDQVIRKGCDGVVYLTEKPEDAVKFLMIRGYRKILVLGVDLEEDMVSESFDHSQAFFKCRAFTYPEDISLNCFVNAQTYDFNE